MLRNVWGWSACALVLTLSGSNTLKAEEVDFEIVRIKGANIKPDSGQERDLAQGFAIKKVEIERLTDAPGYIPPDRLPPPIVMPPTQPGAGTGVGTGPSPTTPGPKPLPPLPPIPPTLPYPGGIGSEIGAMINLWRSAWAIIEAGAPTVGWNANFAVAVPKTLTDWTQLERWQRPRMVRNRIRMKNFWGVDLVSFEYSVHYVYGASVGGKGQYLTNVTIHPGVISGGWKTKLDVKVDIPSVLNFGTQEDPLAGLEVLATFTVKTDVKALIVGRAYFVMGDGTYSETTPQNAVAITSPGS